MSKSGTSKTERIRSILADCWERTKDMEVPQFRDGECEVRRLWDEAVAEAMGWDAEELPVCAVYFTWSHTFAGSATTSTRMKRTSNPPTIHPTETSDACQYRASARPARLGKVSPYQSRKRTGSREGRPRRSRRTAPPKPKPKLRGSRIGSAVPDGADRGDVANFAFSAQKMRLPNLRPSRQLARPADYWI